MIDSARLLDYTLPEGVMRLAPRQPFKSYSKLAIDAFLRFARANPEARGPMIKAAVALGLVPVPQHFDKWFNIEVHVDALNVPDYVQDRLLELGYQIDGFVRFEPAAYTNHYTLKFKLDEGDTDRIRELVAVARSAFEEAKSIFADCAGLEGYVEAELYGHEWRSAHSNFVTAGVDDTAFPFSAGSLRSKQFEVKQVENLQSNDSDDRKKADIHIKIGNEPISDQIISQAVAAGFYLVETWSGNRVLTAQFYDANSAISAFHELRSFLKRAPLTTELTLEFCNGMWRAPLPGGHLSRIPPVCYV